MRKITNHINVLDTFLLFFALLKYNRILFLTLNTPYEIVKDRRYVRQLAEETKNMNPKAVKPVERERYIDILYKRFMIQ